jgi:hypothetical protein
MIKSDELPARVTVRTDTAVAVARWAWDSDKDGHPHLHQVLFHDNRMIACDGHRMVIVPLPDASGKMGVDRRYILAAAAAQAVLRAHLQPPLDVPELTLAQFGEHIQIRLALGVTMEVPAEDTELYPPYRQAIPKKSPLSGYRVDPAFLAGIEEVDAATRSEERSVELVSWSNDHLGALAFRNDAGVQFIVMPMRPGH